MAIITSKTFNGIQLLKVNSNPSGISAPNGSIALDTSTANKYRNVGGDVWNLIVSGSITEPQASGTQGPQGNQGSIGSQGTQGPTGDRGPQGVPGAQGSQGLNGDRGLTGSGTQGPQGNQGSIGSGTQGPQGAQGDRGAGGGAQGSQGYQGSTGDRGPQGVPGSQGNQGSGTQGAQGSTGDRGTQGVPGSQGAQGSTGDRGTQGDQGLQGFQGTTGSGTQGAQGAQGDRGERGQGAGSQGAQGYQGSTGVGTQGPQGVPGSQGATGSGTQGSQGYQGPQGVPGSGGGGASGGLPVINVTTDLVGLGYAANAVTGSGVSSGGDAIQDAIDHFLLNPASFYAIYIPPGVYNISKSLIIAYPPLGSAEAGTFSQCNIISSLNMFPDVGGAKIQWNSGLGKVDPMLVIQGARNVSLSGITFEGPNTAPFNLLDAPNHYEALFTSEYADWLSPDIRDNSRSPQCCVAIDPFLDGYPGGNALNRYPNLTSYYIEKYQRSSSNIVFEHCAFRKSAFGIVISPSGPNSLGVDKIGNSENFYFKNCFFEYNRVHYSTGQSQARANNLFSPRMIGSWIAIDTELVGPGGNNGVTPTFSGAPNIGGCKYVFNINTVNQLLDFSNAYCESIASLGRIDFGGGNHYGSRMAGCTFTFICPGDVGVNATANALVGGVVPGIPYHLSNMSMLHMDRCVLHTGDYPLKFWNNDSGSSRLKLTLCTISTPSNNDKVQVGFNSATDNGGVLMIDSIKVRKGDGSIIQDNPVSNGKLQFQPIVGSLPEGRVTFTEGINATVGTFTVAEATSDYLLPGDLICHYNGEAPFNPEIFTTNGVSSADLWGTIGKVESISSSGAIRTVTVKHIHKGFLFSSPMNIKRLRWITT